MSTKKEYLEKLNNEIAQLDSEINNNNLIVQLYSFLVWEYEWIKNWDDFFNVWDINDVKVSDILENNSDDFWEIIWSVIWESDYESDLTAEDKAFLNLFFANIKDFCFSNWVNYDWDVKSFLKDFENEFRVFLKGKLDEVI